MQRPARASQVARTPSVLAEIGDIRETLQLSNVELRGIGHVEHVPTEAKPVIGDAGRPRLADARIDREIPVAAENVADAHLARQRAPEERQGLGRVLKWARPVVDDVPRRFRRRKAIGIDQHRVALNVPVGCPARATVVNVERKATRPAHQPCDRPVADDLVESSAGASPEAAPQAEGQLGDPVCVDLMAQVEVGRAVIRLRLERVDQEARVCRRWRSSPNALPRSTCDPMSFDSESA